METCVCLAMILLLLAFYWCAGKLFFSLTGGTAGNGLCLLCGTFVYHGAFQLLALPLIFLRKPLSYLSLGWMAVLAALFILAARMGKERLVAAAGIGRSVRPEGTPLLLAVTLAAVAMQAYYIITNQYLGWDTSSYVGTIGTSVSTNTMYCYDGETGWTRTLIDVRYALSSFYMHAAVWCQLLKISAIRYAKITQGGTLAVLANLTIFELGRFLFSGKRYQGKLSKRQRADCATGMVLAAVILNFFYQSVYTTSDFLLNRALEAKGYCANLILPFLFLLGLMMWRDTGKKETRLMLAAVMTASVAMSMSALLTAPVLFASMLFPVLLRERSWRDLRYCMLCILPNAAYFAVYLICK